MKTFVYSVSIEAETMEEADAVLLSLQGQEYDSALDVVMDND
jgi:hypothetical protein